MSPHVAYELELHRLAEAELRRQAPRRSSAKEENDKEDTAARNWLENFAGKVLDTLPEEVRPADLTNGSKTEALHIALQKWEAARAQAAGAEREDERCS